jgi:5S rRNA maturation endonuclease (ribonuclease M5)
LNNSIDFLSSYFKEYDTFYVFLLNREDRTQTKQYYNTIDTFKKNLFNYQQKNNDGWDIYFSVNSFTRKNEKIFRQEPYVKEVKSLFFDIDTNGIEIKEKIMRSLGEPSIQLQTSPEKFQLFYALENMLDIEPQKLKEISKSLTYHFETDTTFDLARVARLPFFINNKNNWSVKVLNFNNKLFNISYFEDFIVNNNLLTPQKKEEEKKNKPVPVKPTLNKPKGSPNAYYQGQYNKFLNRTPLKFGELDYSAADMSFIVYLQKVKKLTGVKTLYKHFLLNCPDVENRHPNTEQYFYDILEKIKTI